LFCTTAFTETRPDRLRSSVQSGRRCSGRSRES